jgi:hypothetical protein
MTRMKLLTQIMHDVLSVAKQIHLNKAQRPCKGLHKARHIQIVDLAISFLLWKHSPKSSPMNLLANNLSFVSTSQAHPPLASLNFETNS